MTPNSRFANAFGTAQAVQPSPVELMPTQAGSVMTINQSSTVAQPVSSPAVQALVLSINKASPTELVQLGSSSNDVIKNLAKTVLDKVKAADAGEFGVGMKQILDLTSSVKVGELGQSTGMFSRIKTMFGAAKNSATHQIDSVTGEIDRITASMKTGVTRMQAESVWLANMREANYKAIENQTELQEALTIVDAEAQQRLIAMKADPSTDQRALSEHQMFADRISRQKQKVFKQLMLAKLTTPQLAGLQVSNENLVEKFGDLIAITIPAWSTTIAQALIGQRQQRDAETAAAVDDTTNKYLKMAADQIHDTTIATTKLLAKDSIETATLVHIQTQMLDMVKVVNELESQARTDRAQSIVDITKLEQDLQTAMRS